MQKGVSATKNQKQTSRIVLRDMLSSIADTV